MCSYRTGFKIKERKKITKIGIHIASDIYKEKYDDDDDNICSAKILLHKDDIPALSS